MVALVTFFEKRHVLPCCRWLYLSLRFLLCLCTYFLATSIHILYQQPPVVYVQVIGFTLYLVLNMTQLSVIWSSGAETVCHVQVTCYRTSPRFRHSSVEQSVISAVFGFAFINVYMGGQCFFFLEYSFFCLASCYSVLPLNLKTVQSFIILS